MPRPRVNHWCEVCDCNPAKALGLCSACYEYRRTHGCDRPTHLARRQADLNWRREVDRQAVA